MALSRDVHLNLDCVRRKSCKTNIRAHDDISAGDMFMFSKMSIALGCNESDCSQCCTSSNSDCSNCSDRLTLPVDLWCRFGITKRRDRWAYWLPNFTDLEFEEVYIAYNIGEHLAAKPQ